MASYKSSRHSEDIRREITDILKGIKDPRVSGKLLTIVRVDISSDLSYGKVFVSCIDGIEKAKEACVGLESAKGYIKRELLKRLKIRKAPDLTFIPDDSAEYAMEIENKIKEVLGD
ncbi:MAG: 30S ribosome-binding factor RbfA [Clostridia bacterium]|nr:30S ribosome-binding factor RbfA [Clostridia bacterium]